MKIVRIVAWFVTVLPIVAAGFWATFASRVRDAARAVARGRADRRAGRVAATAERDAARAVFVVREGKLVVESGS